MDEQAIVRLVENLTKKEREALTAAVTALHFKDEDEYLNALLTVIIAIIGEDMNGTVDMEDLLAVLDPAMLEE